MGATYGDLLRASLRGTMNQLHKPANGGLNAIVQKPNNGNQQKTLGTHLTLPATLTGAAARASHACRRAAAAPGLAPLPTAAGAGRRHRGVASWIAMQERALVTKCMPTPEAP